jgi:hypothetical protein
MPILALFTSDTITPAQYEALRTKIGWERDHPDGGLLHAAGAGEDGRFLVADVWASAEALEAFVQARLAPALEELGIDQPEVAVVPTLNVNVYAAAAETYGLG